MSLEQEFRISSEMADGLLTIHVDGELDMATAPRLSEIVGAFAGVHELVVDLTACEFVDSSGIRELLMCRREIGPETPMTVVGVAPNVARVFRIAGTDQVIPVVTTETRAADLS